MNKTTTTIEVRGMEYSYKNSDSVIVGTRKEAAMHFPSTQKGDC